MKADLEILSCELKYIAETGKMPSGGFATVGMMTWAQGWLLSLAELGVTPAPPSSRTEPS